MVDLGADGDPHTRGVTSKESALGAVHHRPFYSLVTFRDCCPPISRGIGGTWTFPNPLPALPALPALLAATASAGGLVLVTCDLAGVARSDVRVLNPLDPPGHGK